MYGRARTSSIHPLSLCDGKNDFCPSHQRVMTDEVDSEKLNHAHRQSGVMLIFTLALIAFLLFASLGTIAGSSFLIFILLPLPFCIIVVRGYFHRESWALPWVMSIWIIAIGLCFLMMIFEFISASNGSDSWGYIQGFLLLFLCWSMMQRLRLLRHPMFRAWYDGQTPALSQNIALEPDEVLASCPHCHSLLAVQPMSLSAEERCPKCNMRLVSEKSAELYREEE